MRRLRAELASPLSRWTLTALAAIALAGGYLPGVLLAGAAAVASWRLHRCPTPRRSRRGARRR